MSEEDVFEAEGGEGSDIEPEDGRRIEKAKPGRLSAFLAMVLSGVLSLFIACCMFMIGVLWGYREDARELRGLVQFFAVEAVDIYAETAEVAELKLVHGESIEGAAPRMVSAVTLGRANALRVDPSLMATLRSVFGRHARIRRDLRTYKKGGTWHQMTEVIHECKTMGAEVRRVLEIAAEEGVGDEALSPLDSTLADADSRIDTIVEKKKDLFPAVWVTERVTSIPVRPRETAKRNFLVRNWSPDRPLAITGAAASLPCVTVHLPKGATVKPLGEIKIDFEVSPEGLEPGPFEGTITVETDGPGFETMTVTISGRVYPPR